MRLPGATGKAAPGAERGQRIRELTARGQCCGAAVRRQRGGFLIFVFLCYEGHGVFLPVAELLVNFEAASSARVDRSPMEPGVTRGPWTVEIHAHPAAGRFVLEVLRLTGRTISQNGRRAPFSLDGAHRARPEPRDAHPKGSSSDRPRRTRRLMGGPPAVLVAYQQRAALWVDRRAL